MNILPAKPNPVAFNGQIKGFGVKPLKTEPKMDDILLSQLANNLRRIGIDRHPGSINTDGSLIVQPGLMVKHNKKGDQITFIVDPGNKQKVTYTMKKDEKGDHFPTMPDHKTVFEDAIKQIDRAIQKALEKNNILAGVDKTSLDAIYEAIHWKIQ